jgi:glycosyltransferase involved in cell wall biosynthesis
MTASEETERASAPRVLVVEDRAHRPLAHFPNRFAELAEGFAANGCSVEVLTSDGWLYGDRAVGTSFVVRRYGSFQRLLYRLGDALRDRRGFRGVAASLRTNACVRAVRSRCSAAGPPAPLVVVTSASIDPFVAGTRAGNGRWLVAESEGPGRPRKTLVERAQRAEHRRRAAGGRMRIVASNDNDRAQWDDVAGFFDPLTSSLAGSRAVPRVADAKARLGLDATDKVALVFGTARAGKDVDVVARVFAELPDWVVVVAGTIAGDYRPRTGARDTIVLGGFVDEATRALVFSAADVVLLSFQPDYVRHAGVLADAVSWGVPVVCSEGSLAAVLVHEYRLGTVFAPGNPDGLERAVRLAPANVEPEDLARARAELSTGAIAARLLAAAGGEAD